MSTQPSSAQGWSSSDKVTLLMSLISYLTKHGATSVEHLAEHFDASPQLIRNLARFIGTAGVPGDAGAYSHQDLYDIDWDLLELEDMLELQHVVGVDGTPRFTSLQATALIAGLQSLTATLTPEEAVVAERAAAKLRTASTPEGAALSLEEKNAGAAEGLSRIGDAIRTQQQLSFVYLDRDGNTTDRTIDAHRLLKLQGAWYVDGWCHRREDMRTFRLEFMRELSVRSEPQRHPSVAPDHSGFAVHDVTGVEVEVLVDTEKLYRLASWSPTVIGKAPRGRSRVLVTLIHESRVIALVSQAPDAIEVVAPETLRTLVGDWASTMAQALEEQDSVH